MRLDLYLKAARLVRRRAVAAALCDAGQVLVGGQAARASRGIRVGDRVEVRFARRQLLVEVVAVPAGEGVQADGRALYRLLREETGLTVPGR